jgi:hypothetical protein
MSMGARHCRSMGMEGSTGNLREFPISPTNANVIFTGDFVRLNAGYVIEASGAATGANFEILGVFMGCHYVEADGSFRFKQFWDGGAGRTQCLAHVMVPTGATLLIPGQVGGAYTAADIGTRKGIIYAAGNTRTGYSGIRLGAPGATVGTGPLVVVQAVDDVDPAGPYFEVAVARSQLLPATIAA